MGIPSDISTLGQWSDSDSVFAQLPNGTVPCAVDGQLLEYWSDRSGLGNHWQYTTTGAPLYHTPSINGLPGGRGQGAGDNLVNMGLNTAWGDFTIFVVFQRAATPVASAFLIDKTYTTGTYINRDSTNLVWGAGVKEGSAPYGISVTAGTDTAPQIICSMRSNFATTSNHDLWLSGETIHNSNTTPTGLTGTEPLVLFASWNGGSPVNATHSDITATVVYGRALTLSERATVWNYLGTKYGITLSGVGGAGAPRFLPEALGLNSLRGLH
jgi:hypothetical protein